MHRVLVILFVVAAFFFGLRNSWQNDWEVNQPPGVLVQETPFQRRPGRPKKFLFDEITLDAKAEYSITARVLHKKRYYFGREAKLVPFDFALGWGPMSDSAVLDELKITQSNRFYFWRTRGRMPVPRSEIETNSANVHLIPANENVWKMLAGVRRGEVATFDGYLVSASDANGWIWNSSLSRKDTGAGACELMLVESVIKRPRRNTAMIQE